MRNDGSKDLVSELNLQFVEGQRTDGAETITLSRPPLNILNIPMLHELDQVLTAAAREPSMRVLVLRAHGKLFSAGVDVGDHTDEKVGELIPLFNRVCAALAAFPAPTLAVVHGHALGGGCELALCCDIVLAAEGSNFGQPEIKLAAIAPVASIRLPGLAGYRRAAEILFTGEPVEAGRAARWGLINRAVPPAELEDAAQSVVGALCSLSAAGLRAGKRALRAGESGWSAIPEIERIYLQDLMSTKDAHEGVAAFIEKRAPVWRNQ